MGGDPEIAGGRDLEPAAEAPARHPRDHGRREGADGLAKVAQAGDEGFCGLLLQRRHLLDVGAADHALLALAGEHEDTDRPVAASCCRPSRTPFMTAEPRMFSEPALQIETRTTPRESRSTPQ